MHLRAYLRSATEIIRLYEGAVPFAAWLKDYFKQHKKFGSKDRKLVADLCFCFYRLGDAFAQETTEEQLLIGQALCHKESIFVNELKQEWSGVSSLPVEDKLSFFGDQRSGSFFPFLAEVSDEIGKEAFGLSHLVQPDLFLRLRLGKKERVLNKLRQASLPFITEGDSLRLPINTKIDDVLLLNEEVVVQDKSSQQVIDPLKSEIRNSGSEIYSAWDCCAASGGKSLLLHDHFPNIRLTVSDIRESILRNLRARFKRAGIHSYQSFVADASSPHFKLNKKFDLIICDAPCSGSGTWGRTPEQLRFFQKEKIDDYASVQIAIAMNASRHLKNGGRFLYITCSVFKKENEDVVKHLEHQTSLRLTEQRYFKGYEEKADTLFAALFCL